MKVDLRAATPQERLYLEKQSSQIEGQTGYIGVLNGSFEDTNKAFSTKWKNDGAFRPEEFNEELDELVNALRFEDANGYLLKGRDAARLFCKDKPDSAFIGKYGKEYAFRADYKENSYLICLAPLMTGQNFQIRCYARKWLDRHMGRAREGIRFITPDYRELFRISDGDSVRLRDENGSADLRCRFIDETHLEMSLGRSTSLYHICELAERVKQSGKTVVPLRASLPNICYSVLPNTGEAIVVTKGESGYQQADSQMGSKEENRLLADRQNKILGISKAQEAAMQAGAMFGWEVPAADPMNYGEDGRLRRSRQHSVYSMER